MKLYKYTKKAYAKKMIEEGIFRIGTLDDYRDIEKHGLEIGDNFEGQMTTKMDEHEIDSSKSDTLSPVANRILNSDRFIADRVILIAETIREYTDNCLIYSTSKVADLNLMKKINHDYDACVEIIDIQKFFNLITDCLKKNFSELPGGTGDFCTYSERVRHHSNQLDIHPAFVKEPKYSYQQEYRVIWQIRETNFSHYDLTCKQASKYCRILTL